MAVLAFVMKFRDVKDYLAKWGNIMIGELAGLRREGEK